MGDTIPTVDINAPNAAKDILAAAATFGFVFVQSHDISISQGDIDSMFEISRDFFSAPVAVKQECTINSSASGKNRGWLSMHTESLDPKNQKKGDFKEAFNIGEFSNGRALQPLPKPLIPHEAQIGEFFAKCHALCKSILRLFAVALEIDEQEGGAEWFATRHDQQSSPSGSVLRLLYYPALPESFNVNPTLDIRAGAHSDYGSITLLFRLPSQPGLEILTSSNTWQSVPVDPNPESNSGNLPILVNIGDLLSYWTNGLLKSTVHRVIFPKQGEGRSGGEDRYSIAYFCHPQDDAKLVPIPSELVKKSGVGSGGDSGSYGQIMTARDHLNSRLAATYQLG